MYKTLQEVPDAEDLTLHSQRCGPELLTRGCHDVVPVIRFVGGCVTAAGVWGAQAEIPLLEEPMNQNAIQLASNHYLLADWIAALGTVCALPGVTAIGIHQPDRSTPVQIWTLRGEIVHLGAATGTIHAQWKPPPDEVARIRQALIQNSQCEFDAEIDVCEGERVVSKVTLTQAIFVTTRRAVGASISMIQAHAHKVSALLVAGLRTDDFSRLVAGQQGQALAERMCRATPKLRSLVQARTQHLDALVMKQQGRFKQVLIVGIGLDTRPLRLDTGAIWFGVDLEAGLKNRQRRFRAVQDQAGTVDPTLLVAADMRDQGLLEKLQALGFDRGAATLIVLEGVCMYLTLAETGELLCRLADVARCDDSRLWVDHITAATLAAPDRESKHFLDTMARMGEPFISGVDDLSSMAGHRWLIESVASAGEVLHADDALHAAYRFSVLRPT